MNAASQSFITSVSNLVSDLDACFKAQPGERHSLNLSVGYSPAIGEVNASDLPQAGEGPCSSGAVPIATAVSAAGASTPCQAAAQKPCFRGELLSPYGHILF